MVVLVLGIFISDHFPFGGVIDLNKLTNSDDDKLIKKHINKALNETDPLFQNESFIDDSYGNTTKWESMPYTGIIDAEVYIYVD